MDINDCVALLFVKRFWTHFARQYYFQTIRVFEPDDHSGSTEVVRIESDLVKVSFYFTGNRGILKKHGHLGSGPKYIK